MSFAAATATSCGLPSAPSIPLIRTKNSMKNLSFPDAPAVSGRLVPFFRKGLMDGPQLRKTHSYSSSFLGQGLPGIPKALYQGNLKRQAISLVRCEQASGGENNLSLWLGRFAMLGFVGVISIEIITGKGVLEQVGIDSPAPTAALALTAVVGTIAAVAIFRSASRQ